MKKIFYILFVLLCPVILLVTGCVDSINAPDKLPPSVDVYKPATNDSLAWGQYNVNYYAGDDQKLTSIDLYLSGKLSSHYDIKSDGTLPVITLKIDTALVNSTISYYIIATDGAGNTAKSREMTNIYVKENTDPPAAPANLILTKINDTAFNLSWDDSSSNETKYLLIRRDGSSSAAGTIVQTLPANTTSTNDYVNDGSLTYYYKVRATNNYGSSESKEVNSGGQAITSVYGLEAIATSTSRIQLTWVDNCASELGFLIERKISGAMNFAQIGMTLPNATSFEDTSGLSVGATYTYRVAARTQSGIAGYSNEKSITTLSQDYYPPSNLTAVIQPNTNSISLTWTNNSTWLVETRIERKVGSGQFAVYNKVLNNSNSFIDTSVTAPNTYAYRVRGVIGNGTITSYSNTAQLQVSVLPITAPTNLVLTKFADSDVTFNLSWKDNSKDEDGFEIWRKDGYSGEYKILSTTVPPNTGSINVQVPSNTMIYYFQVRAFKGSIKSDFSNQVNSTGGTSNLPSPTIFAGVFSAGRVTLTWDYSISNILGFKIEKKIGYWGSWTQLDQVSSVSREYFDTKDLTAGAQIFYRIKAFSSTEESDWSKELLVNIQ